MKVFIIKIFVFLILLSGVFFYLSLTYKRKYHPETDYMAAMIDKHERLNNLDSNRLILVGGSSLAFGINGEILENQLPIQPVNLGLHAGLGLEFIVNEAISNIKKGDIIVLGLEYPLYLDSFEPDIDLIAFAKELYPPAKDYYKFSFKEKLQCHYERFKKRFSHQELNIDPVFNRKLFDKYGDEIGHLHISNLKELRDRKPIGAISIENRKKYLAELQSKCDEVGAKLYLTYPNYVKSEFEANHKEIIELDHQIRSELPQIKILGKPETFVLADSLFYDTVYHLNAKGRDIRTLKLVELLKPYIQ